MKPIKKRLVILKTYRREAGSEMKDNDRKKYFADYYLKYKDKLIERAKRYVKEHKEWKRVENEKYRDKVNPNRKKYKQTPPPGGGDTNKQLKPYD